MLPYAKAVEAGRVAQGYALVAAGRAGRTDIDVERVGVKPLHPKTESQRFQL
jgi:hypothetical protein